MPLTKVCSHCLATGHLNNMQLLQYRWRLFIKPSDRLLFPFSSSPIMTVWNSILSTIAINNNNVTLYLFTSSNSFWAKAKQWREALAQRSLHHVFVCLSVCLSVCHGPARYLFFVLVTLYQLLRESCAWAQELASYTQQRRLRQDTETLEATGTPTAAQSSSDGDLLSLRSHRHACRRSQQLTCKDRSQITTCVYLRSDN